MSVINYKYAFPDFVLDVQIPEGFVDASWKNDVCPKWYNEAKNMMLYIEYKEPSSREVPEEPRFYLATVDQEQEFIYELAHSDDYQTLLDIIKFSDDHEIYFVDNNINDVPTVFLNTGGEDQWIANCEKRNIAYLLLRALRGTE